MLIENCEYDIKKLLIKKILEAVEKSNDASRNRYKMTEENWEDSEMRKEGGKILRKL